MRSLIISLVAMAAPAWAQLPSATEGRGIKVGEGLVLHPGLAADTTYDSNVYYEDSSEGPVGSPYLQIGGHLDLASLSPQRLGPVDVKPALDFRLDSAFAYREYLSGTHYVRDLRALDLDAGFHATFNPQGLAYFKLLDQFVRTRQPGNSEGSFNITRDFNRAGTELGVRPGGGMMTVAVSYELNVEHYEEDFNDRLVGVPGTASNVGNPDRLWHVLSGTSRWKFLPKTALTLDVAYSIYDKDNAGAGLLGDPAYLDSTALRTYVGIIGLVTPKVTTQLKIGYGRTDYDSGDNYGNLIGTAQLEWRPTLQAKLALGYERNFDDSVVADYFVDDRLYATYEQLVGGRALLSLKPGVRARRYHDVRDQFREDPTPRPIGEGNREDVLAELQMGLSVQLLSWFLVGAAYNLQTDSTNWRDGTDSYVKHVVLFRVEAAF